MSFLKTNTFKYLKNFIIGAGASVVLLGALFKLESWEGASMMLTIGLSVEAFIFLFLGVIGPEKDYYWEKLYPGLDDYHSRIAPLTEGDVADAPPALNGEVVEQQLGGMLTELQTMSNSLGSLKALQEVDFSGTGEQLKTMSNFYTRMSEAMANLNDSLEDTERYKDQLAALNKNLGSLNSVYGNVLSAMSNIGNEN
jgi:GldL N-terminal domain